MTKQTPDLFAAIHIGSENISMQIVEYRGLGNIRLVEKANTKVTIGEEVFKTGKISFGAVSEICDLLKGYRRVLSEYGVRDYRLAATTAIREAANQPYIIDQIKIKTGFSLEVVDLPQEIFYKYVSVYKRIHEQGLTNDQDGILFVDISSGGLGITLYQQGSLSYQQNIHIGILRIKESFDKHQRESTYFTRALDEFIYSSIAPVQQELGCHRIKSLVLSGLETSLILSMLGRERKAGQTNIAIGDLEKLYDQVTKLNLPQIMEQFNLSEHTAEIALPAIVLYKQIVALTDVEQIVIVSDHILDGITKLHIAEKKKDPLLEEIERQLVSLARTIGNKYHYDSSHVVFVEKLSMQFFDRMQRIHGLGKRERLLLQVAAILHDIGKFVSLRRHYFYSYRLIMSSDILGFSDEEKAIMANVAYYHGKGAPASEDSHFSRLSKEQKVKVAKMVAIIKLADALDRSHCQKISTIEIVPKGDELIITAKAKEDISIEEWSFQDKADFFESVFGIKPIIKRQAG